MDGNLAYQERRRYEIIDGEVVMLASPSMNHAFIASNIYELFKRYLRGKICTALPDGMTLYLKDRKGNQARSIPDMMVVCDRSKLRRETGSVYGAPDLVVEVQSPSTARYDRNKKMKLYELNGVREYWIVSPAELSVEQYVLEEGRLAFRDVFVYFTPERLEALDEEDMEVVSESFKCTLFDDLDIRLDEVFYGVEP